jgi:beta-lactamase regulating signal transducer with metallopeptidase domain
MSMPFVAADMTTAVWAIVKVSVLMAAAALAHALLRRRTSAATRHMVWTLGIVGLLLLPLLSAVLPGWKVAVPLATPNVSDAALILDRTARATPATLRPADNDLDVLSPAVATTAAYAPNTPTAVPIPWAMVLPGLYAAGVLCLLIQLAGQRLTVQRLSREARDVSDPEWRRLLAECARSMGVHRPVRLLRGRERTMPMTFGTRLPAILIPVVADTWSEDRRRIVLLHELAHVARHDCLTQMMAAVACAWYWIHPGVWLIARRLRVERELACDDRVLARGARARDYAGHLLELAYALDGHRAPALAVSMARPQQLERRMLAALDAARNRATPVLRSRVLGMAVAAALLVPLAAAQATVVPAGGDTDGGASAAVGSRGRTTPLSVSRVPEAIAQNGALSQSSAETGQSTSPPGAVAPGRLPGTWEIRPSRTAGRVYLRLTEGSWSDGSAWPIERLEGLSPAQLSGAGGPARFNSRRDAGTFTFEGIFRSGVGAGTYTFTPDATFPGELAKRGLGHPTSEDQYALALADIGLAFLDELTTQGYRRPDISALVRTGRHGVRLDYLREMGTLGYRFGLVETLITQRDHGVTPEFIRELGAQGLTGLPAADLLRARDHGVDAAYVSGLRELGYGPLNLSQLVSARDHGVSVEFIRDLGQLGYAKLSLDSLVSARDHGISPEYVRDLRELGYHLTLVELTKARDHGVGAEYIRDLTALGYPRLSQETLIGARDHGISPEYVRDLRTLGYRLSLQELTSARDHGVDPEFIRGLTGLGYNNLPLGSLIRLRDHGVTAEYIREIKGLGYDGVDVDALVRLRDQGVSRDNLRRADFHASARRLLDTLKAFVDGWLK